MSSENTERGVFSATHANSPLITAYQTGRILKRLHFDVCENCLEFVDHPTVQDAFDHLRAVARELVVGADEREIIHAKIELDREGFWQMRLRDEWWAEQYYAYNSALSTFSSTDSLDEICEAILGPFDTLVAKTRAMICRFLDQHSKPRLD